MLDREAGNWDRTSSLARSRDTQSDLAQWLPAGPDGPSLAWYGLNLSEAGCGEKNQFFNVSR